MNEAVIKAINECTNSTEQLSEKPLKEILNYLESLEHFKKLKRLPDYSQLMRLTIRSLNLQSFKRGQVLVRQHDRGDKFYIILSGEVNVYVQHSQQTIKKMNAIAKKICLLQEQENVVNQEAIKDLEYQYRLLQEISTEDKELLQLSNDPLLVKYTQSQLNLISQQQENNLKMTNFSISQDHQKYYAKKVNQLRSNRTFGEFSLAKLGKRTASILAKSNEVVTAWIPYEMYNIIFEEEIKYREGLAKHIQQFFPKLGDTLAIQIAYFFQEKTLLRNQENPFHFQEQQLGNIPPLISGQKQAESQLQDIFCFNQILLLKKVVYREGDSANELFFIQEGNITLTKKVFDGISQNNNSENRILDINQHTRDRQTSSCKRKIEETTVVILQQNQFFGFEQENQSYYFTAISSLADTKIYKLNKNQLTSQVSEYNFHNIIHQKSNESIKRYNQRLDQISQTQQNLSQALASPINKSSQLLKSNPFTEYQLEEKTIQQNQLELLHSSINSQILKKFHQKSKSIISMPNSPSVSSNNSNSPQYVGNKLLSERQSDQKRTSLHTTHSNLITLQPIENNSSLIQNSSIAINLNNNTLTSKTEILDEDAPKSEMIEYGETFQQVKKRLKLSRAKPMKKDQLPQFGNMSHLKKLQKKLSFSKLYIQKQDGSVSPQKQPIVQHSLPDFYDDNMLFASTESLSIRNIPSLKFISESLVFPNNHTNPSSPLTTLNSPKNLIKYSSTELQHYPEQNLAENNKFTQQIQFQHSNSLNQLNEDIPTQQTFSNLNQLNNQQISIANIGLNIQKGQRFSLESNATNFSCGARNSLDTQDSSNNTSDTNLIKNDKLSRVSPSNSHATSTQSIFSTPLLLSNKISPQKPSTSTTFLQRSNTLQNEIKQSVYPILNSNNISHLFSQQQNQYYSMSQTARQNNHYQSVNINEGFAIRKKAVSTQSQFKQNSKLQQNTQEISANSGSYQDEESAQANMLKSISKLSDELFDDTTTNPIGIKVTSPMKSIEEERMKEDLSFLSEDNIKFNASSYKQQRVLTQEDDQGQSDLLSSKDQSKDNFLARRNKKYYSLKLIKSQVNQKINECDIGNSSQQQSLYFFSNQCQPGSSKSFYQKNEIMQNSNKSSDKKRIVVDSPKRFEKLSIESQPIIISPSMYSKNELKSSKVSMSPLTARNHKSKEKIINLNQVELSTNSNFSLDQKQDQQNLLSQDSQKSQYPIIFNQIINKRVSPKQDSFQNETTDQLSFGQYLNEYRNRATSTEFSISSPSSQLFMTHRVLNEQNDKYQNSHQKQTTLSSSPTNKNTKKTILRANEYQISDEAYFTNISKEEPQNEQFKVMLQSSADFLLKKQKGYKETLRNYYNLHKQLNKNNKYPSYVKAEQQKLLPLQINQCITPKQGSFEQACKIAQQNRIQISLLNKPKNANNKSSSVDSFINQPSSQFQNIQLNQSKLKVKKDPTNNQNVNIDSKSQFIESSYPLRITKLNFNRDEGKLPEQQLK